MFLTKRVLGVKLNVAKGRIYNVYIPIQSFDKSGMQIAGIPSSRAKKLAKKAWCDALHSAHLTSARPYRRATLPGPPPISAVAWEQLWAKLAWPCIRGP